MFLPELIYLFGLILFDLIQKGFWCNLLCPTGALLALTSRKKLLKIKLEDASCR
ncbi:MAG: 4Fe-4S binding protein [Eubacteriales bacterium]